MVRAAVIPKCALSLVAIVIVAVGCAANHKQAATRQQIAALAQAAMVSQDPQPQVPLYVQLDVYVICLPAGTVGKDEEFWKRVDEQCFDVPTQRLLFENAVRAGGGSVDQWDYFRQIMERSPVQTQSHTFSGTAGRQGRLTMNSGIAVQTIFYVNREHEPMGRTYEDCQNVLAISYDPVPRKPGSVRVAVCPVVRGTRRRLQYTPLGAESEIREVVDESQYDVNLIADIPPEGFLVIAPSEAALARPGSLGSAFFLTGGPAEQFEQVILLVPRQYRLDASTRHTAPLNR